MRLSGTSLFTTAASATIEFSPIVTPGRIVVPAPIHAFRLMCIGFVMEFNF